MILFRKFESLKNVSVNGNFEDRFSESKMKGGYIAVNILTFLPSLSVCSTWVEIGHIFIKSL